METGFFQVLFFKMCAIFRTLSDIMEPYRPFIDALVFSNISFFDCERLEKEHKAELLRALTMDVKIANENRPLLNAISFTTASLARCFLKEQNTVIYPEFPSL